MQQRVQRQHRLTGRSSGRGSGRGSGSGSSGTSTRRLLQTAPPPNPPFPPDAPPDAPALPAAPPSPPLGTIDCSQYDCSSNVTAYGSGMATWTITTGTTGSSGVCSGNLGGPPIATACIGTNPKSGLNSFWCMKSGNGNATISVNFTEPLWATSIGIFVADCTGSFISSNRISLRLADGSLQPVSCPVDRCNGGVVCKSFTYW
ncbi:hypothetical protein HYH02_003279 [Chlamydomonas schloesseri]|uniref:Uncharacterized protein n=1 Tax=Chlamydomonas schloesseri TaxID=2026947 RepID=A0A836BAM2_9CHLO|nr:hypothetical protein HYH02_003279 [Chlamydomonas schloesseri]|eukprot:KAG2452255.1 hypothetical protein HYH02_003279 [Chlamydomonas schloesseri]